MNLIYAALAFLMALALALVGVTRVGSWLIERRVPPIGEFADIDGARIHYVHIRSNQCGSASDRLHPWRQRQS